MVRFLVIAVIIGVQLTTTGCLFDDQPHTPDAVLIENFEKNRDDFEQLATMCREDANMARIAPDFLWRTDHVGWPRPQSEWGITQERWDEYRELFTKLRIPKGVNNYQPKMTWFISSTQGMVTSGSSKGYAYLSEPPKRTEESLDGYKFQADDRAVYRHLTGHWYLYYEAN